MCRDFVSGSGRRGEPMQRSRRPRAGPRLSHAKSDPHRHTGTVGGFLQSVKVPRQATAAGVQGTGCRRSHGPPSIGKKRRPVLGNPSRCGRFLIKARHRRRLRDSGVARAGVAGRSDDPRSPCNWRAESATRGGGRHAGARGAGRHRDRAGQRPSVKTTPARRAMPAVVVCSAKAVLARYSQLAPTRRRANGVLPTDLFKSSRAFACWDRPAMNPAN
jgi:hypothetical protein